MCTSSMKRAVSLGIMISLWKTEWPGQDCTLKNWGHIRRKGCKANSETGPFRAGSGKEGWLTGTTRIHRQACKIMQNRLRVNT